MAATTDNTGLLQYPNFDFYYPYGQSAGIEVSPAATSDTLLGDHIDSAHSKRKSTSASLSPHPAKKSKRAHQRGGEAGGGQRPRQGKAMESSDGAADTPGAIGHDVLDTKPKRVRTGCLTCRQRHLKCDEGKPVCQNCRKSNRKCVTGVRLNFIDTKVEKPPVMAHRPLEYQTAFADESRDIASEYEGGAAKYGPVDNTTITDGHVYMEMSNTVYPPAAAQHQNGILSEAYAGENHNHSLMDHDHAQRRPSHHQSESTFTAAASSYGGEQSVTPHTAPRGYLDTQEEVLYMQAYVDEVGLWMDSMDPTKHVLSAPLQLCSWF